MRNGLFACATLATSALLLPDFALGQSTTLHVKHGEFVGIASEGKLKSVRICSLDLQGCKPMEQIASGFFLLRDASVAKRSGVYLAEYSDEKGTFSKVFDLRTAEDWGRGSYVVLGALIGFLSTLFVRGVEGFLRYIRLRVDQIDQLRANIISAETALASDIGSAQTATVVGLSPFGVAYLAAELKEARTAITEFGIKKKNLDEACGELEKLSSQLLKKRGVWKVLAQS